MSKRVETPERMERIKKHALAALEKVLEEARVMPVEEFAQVFDLGIKRYKASPETCEQYSISDPVTTQWLLKNGSWADTATGEFWVVRAKWTPEIVE